MQVTTDELNEIFCSGGQSFRIDQQNIHDIQYLLETGLLQMETDIFIAKELYTKQIDEVQKNKHRFLDFEGGEIGHIALKVLAKEYLMGLGYAANDISVEKEFMGFRPDVMTSDLTYIIECGNTEGTKVFKYFQNHDVKSLIILPYPHTEDTIIKLIRFLPRKDLSDFLIFAEEQHVKKASAMRTKTTRVTK